MADLQVMVEMIVTTQFFTYRIRNPWRRYMQSGLHIRRKTAPEVVRKTCVVCGHAYFLFIYVISKLVLSTEFHCSSHSLSAGCSSRSLRAGCYLS